MCEQDAELYFAVMNDGQFDGAKIIEDVDSIFIEIKKRFPPRLGGIDWKKANLISSTHAVGDIADLARVLREFDAFCEYAQVSKGGNVTLLSDDYFSVGVECSVDVARSVIGWWQSLPHAFIATTSDFDHCFLTSFNGSTYYGSAVGQM